ncbi:MAG: type II toxin-antitoxin system VapC family toxin [Blastocatellia bacterium]|nr:type II toxin-antitoxin system VapC family toxin [Blastocatellia bacterium]
MSNYVLDSSAVLALLQQEPGKEKVEAILDDSVMSAVNYCEILGKLIDAGVPDGEARESVDILGVGVVGFDVDQARLAAALSPATKSIGLSLGDRSCLALGLMRDHTVVTADKAWGKLKIGLKIDVIR